MRRQNSLDRAWRMNAGPPCGRPPVLVRRPLRGFQSGDRRCAGGASRPRPGGSPVSRPRQAARRLSEADRADFSALGVTHRTRGSGARVPSTVSFGGAEGRGSRTAQPTRQDPSATRGARPARAKRPPTDLLSSCDHRFPPPLLTVPVWRSWRPRFPTVGGRVCLAHGSQLTQCVTLEPGEGWLRPLRPPGGPRSGGVAGRGARPPSLVPARPDG